MNFTSKQKEIVARKLGYDGPMQGFDEYIKSSPALSAKFSAVTQKYVEKMAKGGVVRKYVNGGDVLPLSDPNNPNFVGPKYYEQSPITTKTTQPIDTTSTGVPIAPGAPQINAAQIQATQDQMLGSSAAPAKADSASSTRIPKAATAAEPSPITASTVNANQSTPALEAALSGVNAAQGTVSKDAQVDAAQGTVSDESIAKTQQVGSEYIKPVVAGTRDTQADELVTAATADQAAQATAAQTNAPASIQAAQGTVAENELVKAAQIKEEDMAQAEAITADGLSTDATAVAARLEKFTVDAGTLAEAAQGNVDAQSTVQGQLTELMKSFDDGKTPAWAAGAIRAANAVMSSRGLGGSSMAGAAIFQAAMESALPIASQDAQTFAQMGIANLNNRQQVALSNAAAQQGLALQNLNNEQQAALQNSTNAFALQSQNLSNMQQTMLANTQIKAALQGQNLTNQQQAAVVNAARYAEMNNINLNNVQQARLQDSTNALQVDLANLSNRQQTAIANAQLQAALQGKNLDNQQQAAVVNATRIAENNNMTFNAEQTAQLQNSELMKTIGVANLNAAQTATLANAATYAAMDIANLNAQQQALVTNAQAFLQMDMANLNNEQQTTIFKTQQITQSILSDTAATNAAAQFNASSQNQTDQFMANLAMQASQFNAAQTNAVSQFNVDQTNSIEKFNTEAQNARDQFNSQNRLVIDQSNAQWLRDISTANTAAVNAANYANAQNMQQMTLTAYNNEMQKYRDEFEMAWSSLEKNEDRATQVLVQQISSTGSLKAAESNADASLWSAVAKVGVEWALSS